MMHTAAVMPARKVSWPVIDAVGLRAMRQMTAAAVIMMTMMASSGFIGGLAMRPSSSEASTA